MQIEKSEDTVMKLKELEPMAALNEHEGSQLNQNSSYEPEKHTTDLASTNIDIKPLDKDERQTATTTTKEILDDNLYDPEKHTKATW